LEILVRNEKLSFATLLRNLPIILKTLVFGPSRIRELIAHILDNQQFDPSGQFIGRANMILGLLYKTMKRRALAIKYLTEAKRMFALFGQSPLLQRVETALAELGG
jgi:hypothetical protein